MHLALILDEERLAHEHAMINRLSVGLIAEGVTVTSIVPDTFAAETADEDEQRIALAARIPTSLRVLPWMRGERRGRLEEAFERKVPDVIYAVGEQGWSLGRDVARSFDRPLLLDLWSAGQLRRLGRRRTGDEVAGYTAPTQHLADAMRDRVDPRLVFLVPMGVGLPGEPRTVLADPDRSIALTVTGGGRDVRSYEAMLRGLSRVIKEMPQIQVFLELDGPHEHEIWRSARRLGLLENVSAITNAARHRALLTRCDLLLVPEQYGEVRSIVLEAMAFGMPVVASEDPFLDMLVDGKTAVVVAEANPDAWARPLRRLLTEPEAARALGLAGRERVAVDHRSSDQVARLIDVLERLTSAEGYRFHEGV